MHCGITTESLLYIIQNSHAGNPLTAASYKFIAEKWKLREKYNKRKLYSDVMSKEKLKCM
jgi:hypothetical protein